VDQASVTGESMPVDKVPGDKVFAGSVNGEGALEVSVTRLAKDSTLARVMKMVEEAQTQKSPTQQTVEKFESVFVPGGLMVTALVIVVPPLLGVPFQVSFVRAMTLLVAASPCALALGTPASILAGIAQAARNGVLVKGGAHLENLGRLKAIAFDKTGTLTHGRPEVTDVIALNSVTTNDQLLALAAAMESRSGHPLAQAVVRAAQAKRLARPAIGDVESLTGQGLRSRTDGEAVLIGNRKLMDESGVGISADAAKVAEQLQGDGKTLVLIALGEQLAGVIGLADTVRPEAKLTMAALKRIGVQETVMLTGDNARVAAAIAAKAGLTDVRADLMPEDKLTAIRDLVQKFGQVAMVGDGVNDAPALANATVGIAMGNNVHGEFWADSRNVREQGRAGSVNIHAHLVDDALNNIIEGVRQGCLVHVMLVQSHPNGFGINFYKFGEWVLRAACNGNCTAQSNIEVGEFLTRQG